MPSAKQLADLAAAVKQMGGTVRYDTATIRVTGVVGVSTAPMPLATGFKQIQKALKVFH